MPRVILSPYDRAMRRCLPQERGFATPCLIFQGCLDASGYGMVSTGSISDGTAMPRRLHVIVWERHHGPIPKGRGLAIDHLCRQRACGEVTHLELVTTAENLRRGVGPERARAYFSAMTHCKHGHEYSEENTIRYTNREGHSCRRCRSCERIRSRK